MDNCLVFWNGGVCFRSGLALFWLDLRANFNDSNVLVWFGVLLFANTLLNLMRSAFLL